jgi:hypothetical protein
MSKLKVAAQQGNAEALLAMHYSYAGSRLLWQLDDNTIVMDELAIEQAKLDTLVARYALKLNLGDYDPNTLRQF